MLKTRDQYMQIYHLLTNLSLSIPEVKESAELMYAIKNLKNLHKTAQYAE